MTITDGYTGATGSISLAGGDDVYAVTSKLNALFASKGMTLSASTNGSQLTIAGSKYGSAASYTVAYSRDDAVAGTSTPISTSPNGFSAGTYAGLDVQGKIYTKGGTPPAEVVTGNGQLLTGAEGTDADGLSVIYDGSGTGTIGDLSFVVGAAGMMERIAKSYTSPGDGVISLQLTSLSDAITALQKRQTDAQARITSYQNSLVRQFTAMETALSQFQSTGSWLTSQINSINAMQAAK
jgi:flagellar hook-associated protein 2